jgi:hypothetical protein
LGAAPATVWPFFFLGFEMMRKVMIIIAVSLLTACGSPNDPGVGGVTKAEAEQLNEAAEMLNQDKPPPSVVKPADAR